MINAKEETLRIAKNQAKRRGEYDIAGEYYYKEKEAMRKQIMAKFKIDFQQKNKIPGKTSYFIYLKSKDYYRALIKSIWNMLKMLILGYGERPGRALGTSFVLIIIYGIIYWTKGLLSSQGDLNFLSSLFFSMVTFTTVGYGNITPKVGCGEIVASTEMFIGVTFIAMWTATLVRKMTR
jgi:hypothetical protein